MVAVLKAPNRLDGEQIDDLGRLGRALVLVVLELTAFECEEPLAPLRGEHALGGFHLEQIAADGHRATFGARLHAASGMIGDQVSSAKMRMLWSLLSGHHDLMAEYYS